MTSEPTTGHRRALAAVVGAELVVGVGLLAWLGWSTALGYGGGLLTGAGMMSALILSANRLVVPAHDQPAQRWPFLALHLAKFPLAGVLAYVVVIVLHGSVAGFAAGYLAAVIGALVLERSSRAGALATDGRKSG